jgi:hypothetical protein
MQFKVSHEDAHFPKRDAQDKNGIGAAIESGGNP